VTEALFVLSKTAKFSYLFWDVGMSKTLRIKAQSMWNVTHKMMT